MNVHKRHWFDAILFIVAAALYAPSLRNGFVGDDVTYFIGNQHIKSFDVLTILRSGAIGADYLPLRDLSFALDYLLWGENPFGFHLMNVILFGFTAIGIKHLFVKMNSFLTGQEDERGETPAFFPALVFAIHPYHREVVYAIYNRGALLTVFFCILACLFFISFLRGGKGRYRPYAAALLCYALALMSREYSIILPMALVALVYFDDRSKWTARFMHTLPYFLVAAFFYVRYREVAVAANYIKPSSEPLLAEIISKMAVALKIMLFYPVQMVTHLGEFTIDDSPAFALAAMVIVAGLVFAAFKIRHRYPQALFGMLFYLACLVPVLNFFRTVPIVAPRYSFLPCVGLFFILMAVPYEGKRKLVPATFVLFTLIWTLATVQNTYHWKDNVSYWEPLAARDKSPREYMELGYAYSAAGRYAEALEVLSKVQPVPWEPKYHAAIGEACFQLGDYECAIRSYETALGRR